MQSLLDDISDALKEQVALHAIFVTHEELTLADAIGGHQQLFGRVLEAFGALLHVVYDRVQQIQEHGVCSRLEGELTVRCVEGLLEVGGHVLDLSGRALESQHEVGAHHERATQESKLVLGSVSALGKDDALFGFFGYGSSVVHP